MGQACSSSSSSSWAGVGLQEDLTLTLPDECLACIFGKLGCHERNNCSLVCKRWSHVDSNSRQRLVLFALSDISPWLPSLFNRFSSISALLLKCSRKLASIDNHSLARIPILLPSLKKLKLKGCVDVTDDGLLAFSNHRPPLLSKLSFASCGIGSHGIISLLLNCPSLRDLTLKRLRKLDAENATSFNDDDDKLLMNLKTHNKLERLCLKDLHNAGLFVPLLSSSSLTLKTLIVCRSCGNWDRVLLESLQAANTTTSIIEIQIEKVQMGDEGLVAISTSCPQLQVLYLSRATDCTDGGLFAIANSCKKLRKLHIDAWSRFGSGRAIGEEGFLSMVSKCPNLQEVVLMGIPVSVTSLNVLASTCPLLERMALCNTDSVGDSEMQCIASKFAALKKLCIKNCPISDAGVKAVVDEGCPSLVKLKVKRCRGVTTLTEAMVSKLRMKRRCLVVCVDSSGSMLLDEDALDLEEEGNAAAPPSTSHLPLRNSNSDISRRRSTSSSSSSTHVICSSRAALVLRSSLQNALQLHRRRRSNLHSLPAAASA